CDPRPADFAPRSCLSGRRPAQCGLASQFSVLLPPAFGSLPVAQDPPRWASRKTESDRRRKPASQRAGSTPSSLAAGPASARCRAAFREDKLSLFLRVAVPTEAG